MKTDRELIDEWLATHEPTKCPPAYCAPVTRQVLTYEERIDSMQFVKHPGAE